MSYGKWLSTTSRATSPMGPLFISYILQNYRIILEMPSSLLTLLEMWQKREIAKYDFKCECRRFYHQLTALLAQTEGTCNKSVRIIYLRGWCNHDMSINFLCTAARCPYNGTVMVNQKWLHQHRRLSILHWCPFDRTKAIHGQLRIMQIRRPEISRTGMSKLENDCSFFFTMFKIYNFLQWGSGTY